MGEQMDKAGGNGVRKVKLSDEQQRYIKLRIQGYTQEAASEAIGVHRNTGYNWEKRPELRISEAISAGKNMAQTIGEVAASEYVSETYSEVKQTITRAVTAPAIAEYLAQKQLEYRALMRLEDIMDGCPREEGEWRPRVTARDMKEAAIEILKLCNTQQTLTVSRTESSEVKRGISDDGVAFIEASLLGTDAATVFRERALQKAWDGMRVKQRELPSAEPEEPSDRGVEDL